MSSNNPLVSIVVPIYNHAHYVEEALHSVFYQTYDSLEVILIDDGSKDNSVAVVEAWLNKNQECVRNRQFTFIKQENQGAHNTINRGLQLAKGEFLTILNSDDYYHLRRIELIVKKIKQENGEFAFSRVHAIDETGKSAPRGNWWWAWYERAMLQLALLPTIGFKLLQDNITVSTGNLFFSRRIFEEVGEFKDLKLAHDYDFVMRALAITEPLLVPQELYFYRLHSDNTTQKVLHLIEQELCEIYRSYLSLTYAPPRNKLAPCQHYWPVAFSMHRQRLALDRSLSIYLEHHPKAKRIAKSEAKLPRSEGEPITLITHDLSLSGGPKLLCDMAKSLKENGYEPRVLSLNPGPLQTELEKEGIPLRIFSFPFANIPKSKVKKLWLSIKVLFAIWRLGGKKVIGNTSLSWPGVLIGSIAFPWKKFYWYIHESSGPDALLNGHIMKKLLHKSLKDKKIDFWFGSKATREIWGKSGYNGKLAYWSGLESSPAPAPKQSITRILSIGTGEPRKGFHYLIDAFIALVKEKRIPETVTLTLAGFSNQLDVMQSFYSDLILKVIHAGLKDRITFLLTVDLDQLEELYDNCDLYIQASTMECLPLTLLKAMSKGLPIITSDANGCTEAIEHQVNGYVFPIRNSNLLAECIQEAISHPETCMVFGKRAQIVFNTFYSKEVNTQEILNHLENFGQKCANV